MLFNPGTATGLGEGKLLNFTHVYVYIYIYIYISQKACPKLLTRYELAYLATS